MAMKQIPVYLFTGFLEAGKTTLLQETLSDPKFNEGESILVLLCEEGEEELDLTKMPKGGPNITCVTFDEEQMLTPDRLSAAAKRCKAERVLVEYNGMWNIDSLYSALPEDWFVFEEMCLMDATTAQAYNTNMRQLMVDKLSGARTVIFNRMEIGADVMPYHKLVRAINRRCGIGYEYTDRTFTPDEIEDPLPFDLAAPVVEIGDEDYAVWYAHISENTALYHGKTISFKGIVARDPSMGNSLLAVGRPIMTCCADDIEFRPLIAKMVGKEAPASGTWVTVTGKISVEKNEFYQGKGPVLYISEAKTAEAPANPVATYY